MSIPADLKYAETHEWARKETDGTISVGITHHAQDLLGDMVYVESPQIGRKLKKSEECGVVESVKAASDIYAPVSGEVIAVNSELDDAPQNINENAYQAWIFKLRPDNMAEMDALLDASAYATLVDSEAH
jgi:glycine cleavage system H protein